MFDIEAKNCFDRAEKNYKDALRCIDESKYAEAVDKFHDLIENALKTLLNLYEIPYKPTHNIIDLLPKIVEKMQKDDPNFYIYSETVLPPFFAIHKILNGIRNMARYGYCGLSPDRIFNEGLATSIRMMIETNYRLIKGWIVELFYNKENL
ncbi:MAG: HEPN domain-containing protein [Methanocellales archaeon]|nr:HEPN domain-containing protein [Methanocellales archaeon]MDD3292346.1 HEPN domain-containing protein [Methanocellales archaeon]MDD5235604.1 HEPN domain-containing protein [Methanocellales archaeon]MDD5485749.1 HEPN domain-containing protein [Methanocellales archaeon]